MKARLRKKIQRRPWVSNSKLVDIYGDRYERYRYVAKDGKMSYCRVVDLNVPDPMMDESGCRGEFANDGRKSDMRNGCPRCTEDVLLNASEPDVMRRWGFR